MMTSLRISILFILICSYILGQNTNQYDPKVNSVPTSPEVALLGRFGDIPVGHYTGTANVSIPLYNLKVDNIEIPLVLSYHTSGIKVADEATWVGLGWSFMPEGTITQEIRGKEDAISGGDFFHTSSGYDIFKNNFFTLASQSQISRLQVGYNNYNSGSFPIVVPNNYDSEQIIYRLNEKYGQPDIFSYNFYGYSGKFFYNPENSSEILFMESNDDVKFSRNSQGFIATTNKGDKYYFHTIEKSKTDQNSYTDIGYTFKITQIVLANGRTISFSYQNESTYQQYPTEVAHLTQFSGPVDGLTINTNVTINEKKTLIGIETEDTKIEFHLGDREDIKPLSPVIPIKRLTSVDIRYKHSNIQIKSFIFNHSYFPTIPLSTIEDGYKHKRLKLDNIQEINYNNLGQPVQNIPPYNFEYDTTYTMPSKISVSDFYGYFNGIVSNTLLPNLNYFDYINNYPYKNVGLSVTSPPTSLRYTNPEYISTNILKKIWYPTGARTEFEYESNTFANQFIPTIQQAEFTNKRNVSLTHRGASTVPGGSYTISSLPFTVSQTASYITFKNTIYDGFYGPNNPQQHYDFFEVIKCKMQLFKRKLVNGQYVETLLKEWSIGVPKDYFEQSHQQSWDETISLSYDAEAQYIVKAYNPIIYNSNDGIHRAAVSSNFIYYDETFIDKSLSYGHGVRIKSLKNYENNTLLSHKDYTYNDGKLIYNFEPLNLIKHATYKSQPGYVSGGCFYENVSVFNDLSINSSDFGIAGNKPFGYTSVIEKDINVFDGTPKGSTKYYFTNNVLPGSSLKGIPRVDIPSNGENVLIEKFDQSQNRVYSLQNIYDNLPNTYSVYPSFHMVNSSTGSVDPNSNAYPYSIVGCSILGTSYSGGTAISPVATTKYHFIVSPLITGKRRLKMSTETQYFGTRSLIDKTELFYNIAGNLSLSKKTSIDGKITDTEYEYAGNISNSYLVNKNMTGIPLITTTTSDNKILNKVETKYDNPNHTLPTSILSRNIQTGNLETEVSFDEYDSKGNLIRYTSKDNEWTTIIWGYNQTLPIIKISGGRNFSNNLIDIAINASNQDALDPNNESLLLLALDDIRKDSLFADYQISTYTYDPLIGVTSITPPSGIREIYKYDSANRLESIKDVNGKIIKEFQYNYKH